MKQIIFRHLLEFAVVTAVLFFLVGWMIVFSGGAAMNTEITAPAIADAYLAAGRIVNDARSQLCYVSVLWEKAKRIENYLNDQARAELTSVLTDDEASHV